MSATVDGGMIVSYRPAGNSTVRCAQLSRVESCSSIESVGTSTKSGVLVPAHALAPSRLALISTDARRLRVAPSQPVRRGHERRLNHVPRVPV